MNLCQIPGCHQRGKHWPSCDDDACKGCLPRLATEGLACDWHVDRAERQLTEIIDFTPDARAIAYGEVRRSTGGGSNKPGSRSPGNDDAMDVINAVQNALTTIARDIAETRGLQIDSAGLGDLSPADPLTRAAKWLTGQLDWLRHATGDQGEAYAAGVFAEIGDCAGRMRSLVDGPSDQRYLGPCGAWRFMDRELDEDRFVTEDAKFECDGDVYGRPGADRGRCKTCGAQVSQDERRAWLDDAVRQYAYTAREIADAYRINVKTIRSWADRGLLAEHGRDRDGRPLHNLGEVLELAAGDAARREEARATRARRQSERMSA
jgi:hypothetical protein